MEEIGTLRFAKICRYVNNWTRQINRMPTHAAEPAVGNYFGVAGAGRQNGHCQIGDRGQQGGLRPAPVVHCSFPAQ